MKRFFIRYLFAFFFAFTGASAVSYGQITQQNTDKDWSGTATGTDTYSVTISKITASAPYNFQTIYVRFTNPNTGASTLRVTGATTTYSAIGITLNGAALVAGDIIAAATYILKYNTTTTKWELQPYTTPASTPSWKLTGNAGTVAGTNFIGTTDNIDLIFKRNSVVAGIITNSSNNTAFGNLAFNLTSTASANTAMGNGVLNASTNGGFNTGVGTSVLNINTTGIGNTGIGVNVLALNIGGNTNTGIGLNALNKVTGTGNVGVGAYAGNYVTGSNQFFVNNQDRTDFAGDTTKSLLYGKFTAAGTTGQWLRVNAALKIVDGSQGAGKLFVSDANGMGTWTTVAGAGAWTTTGNAGTTAGTNFVGTTDGIDLVFKANSQEAFRVKTSTYFLGIGKTTAGARLDVYKGGNGATDYTARFMSSDAVSGAGGIVIDQGVTYGYKIYASGTGTVDGTLSFNVINVGTGAESYSNILALGTGRVGIGDIPSLTAGMNGRLAILGGSTISPLSIRNASSNFMAEFTRPDNTTRNDFLYNTGATNDWRLGQTIGESNFHLYSYGTGADAITVNRAGAEVGIGMTAASAEQLSVKASTSNSSSYVATFWNSSSADVGKIRADGLWHTGLYGKLIADGSLNMVHILNSNIPVLGAGDRNTVYGNCDTGVPTVTGQTNTLLGCFATMAMTGSRNIAIASYQQTIPTSGSNNISIGGFGLSNTTRGSTLSIGGYCDNDYEAVLGYHNTTTGYYTFTDWYFGAGKGASTNSLAAGDLDWYITNRYNTQTDVAAPFTNWNFHASAGTGTGAGGDFVWKTAPAGATGSVVNTYVEKLRLTSTGLVIQDSLTSREEASVIADDGSIDLASGASGWGQVFAYSSGTCDGVISFRFNSDASVTEMAVADALNSAVADTDTKICAFDNGTSVRIRNRLGGTRTLKLVVHY